jgi:hypothetical protein
MMQYGGVYHVRFEVLSREEATKETRDTIDGEGAWGEQPFSRIIKERTPYVDMSFSGLSSGWTQLRLGHVYRLHTWLNEHSFESELVEEFWYGDLSDVPNEMVRSVLEMTANFIAKGTISGEAAEEAAKVLCYHLYSSSERFHKVAKEHMPGWAKYTCEWGSWPKRIGIIDIDRHRGEWVAIYDVDEKKESFHEKYSWAHRYPPEMSSEEWRMIEDKLIGLATAAHELAEMAEQQERDREENGEDDDENMDVGEDDGDDCFAY